MKLVELFIKTYDKIFEEFLEDIEYEDLKKSLQKQLTVTLRISSNNVINLHQLLFREGFLITDRYQWENGLLRFFTGKIIWDALNVFKIVHESLKENSCYLKVFDILSDNESVKVFTDYLEFSFIIFLIGDVFRLSHRMFSKLSKVFEQNTIIRNIINFQTFFKNISERISKTDYKDIILFQSSEYGEIYTSSYDIGGLLYEIEKKLYYYDDYVKVERGDIVIEGGAFDGKSTIVFAKDGAEMIYAFEPYGKFFEICSLIMKLNDLTNVKCINEALGCGVSKSAFNPEDARLDNHGDLNITVNVTSIDDFVKSTNIRKVDFIKLDVEGTEIDVIKGGIRTLSVYHPKIAVAVYHNALDICKITEILQQSGYTNFFLKHLETSIGGLTLFAY